MRFTDATKDLLVGVFFSLLALLFIFVLNPYGIDRPTASYQTGAAAIHPAFFPNMVCWGVFIFGLGLAAASFLDMRKRSLPACVSPEAPKSEAESPRQKAISLAVRIFAMVTLVLLYYLADFLGIVIAGFIFYLLYAVFTGERRPLRAVVGATATSLVLYYFFVKVASVPLPLGLLSDIL